MDDTIVALATALGEASIHVLRLSGPDSPKIVEDIFVPKNQERWQEKSSYTLHLGNIMDNNKLIDQVLVSRMYAPTSFTGEDVFEVNCHGGIYVAQRLLELCLKKGARLADPGEFTKRAFLNGKLDLIQAEAIIDLITAKTNLSADLALEQLDGLLSERINDIREEVLAVLAFIEAGIDFPEDDVEELNRVELKEKIIKVKIKLENILDGSRAGKIIREGLHTVIVGQPNVGKSSLLNALLQEERAIVTDIPGTTRDEIRESYNMGGVLLNLVDTAGIRESEDEVERIGISRAWKNLKKADLILLIIQAGELLTEEEERIINENKDRVIVLVNKIDLCKERTGINEDYVSKGWIPFSIRENIGFKELEEKIKDKVFLGKATRKGEPLLSNVRQINLLEQAFQSLLFSLNSLEQDMPWDIMSIDVRAALQAISEITGHNVQETLVDDIFSRFCIGK